MAEVETASASEGFAARAALALVPLAVLAFAFRSLGTLEHGLDPAPEVGDVFYGNLQLPFWMVAVAVVGLLLARAGRAWRSAGAAAPLEGGLVLAGALGFFAWSLRVEAPDLTLLSLIGVGSGLALTTLGRRAAAELTPPLFLLVFALPWPGSLWNTVVFALQEWTTQYAELLMRTFGYAVVRQGTVLEVPEAAFVVIESCSGLGSMRVLAFLAASYAMAFRVGFLHGLALVLAAPAIAFALNGVRVMFTAIHPHSEAWGDHSTQGLVVFAIGTLVLAALDFVLSLRGRAEARAPEVGGPGFDARTGITGLWVGALAFVLVSFVPPFELGPRLDLPNVLPRGLEGWAFEEKERLPLQFLGRVGYSQAGLARFSHVDEAHEVELFVGLEEFRERGKSGLSRKNSLPGSPWESQGPGRIVVPGFTLNDHRIRRNQEERLVYWEELGARSRPSEALRQFLGVDRSPWRRERPAWVIRLSTPVEPGPAGPTYARGRLRRFLKALRPQWEFRLRQG